MNTKKHEVIAAELIAGKQGGVRLLELLRSKSGGAYTFYLDGNVALLTVMNKGRTASLLTSIPTNEVQGDTLQALLRQATKALASEHVSLAQIVLDEISLPIQLRAITEAGFEELAKLCYLERKANIALPYEYQKIKLHLQTMESISDAELGKVLEETYIGSLDCPNLHGVRPVQDIIEGHRMSTPYQPEYWFIGYIEDSPACVLLLNPNGDNLELAYVGVVPALRERGIADCCLAKTIEIAQHDDFQRITLVIDKANKKASKLYAKWNFAETQSRHAFMYKLC